MLGTQKCFSLKQEKVKIRSRAYKILHYRERSIKELKHRLLHIGFDQLLVDEVIDDFVSDKTLDDERFARAFVSDYTKLKPKGNRFIYNELIKEWAEILEYFKLNSIYTLLPKPNEYDTWKRYFY